jgi:hypothetical protein
MMLGDIVDLTAKMICAEYNTAATRSVVSARMRLRGISEDTAAARGREYRFFLVGGKL